MNTAMLFLAGVIAACLIGMLVELLMADREPAATSPLPPWGDEPLPKVVPLGNPVRLEVERYLRIEAGRGGDDGADERGEWRI